MADYRSPALQMPPRKPVGGSHAGLQFHHSSGNSSPHYTPQNSNTPQPQSHRPRTASSSFFPTAMQPMKPMAPVPGHPQPQPQLHTQNLQHPAVPSRHPSNATSSTGSTGGNGFPARNASNSQYDIRRSSSSKSTNTQSGYVAMMRRQRATVWSDRAQAEDPRVLAQRRAAKQRAMLEVQGGVSGRSSTLLSGGKIRHSTAAKGLGFNNSTMIGTGVPLRLSANEVGEEEDDLDRGPMVQHRTGSGRSSTGSNRAPTGQRGPQGRLSSSSSSQKPPSIETPEVRQDIPEIVETVVDTTPYEDHSSTNQIEQRTRSFQLHDPGDFYDDYDTAYPRTRTLQLHSAEAMDRPEYPRTRTLQLHSAEAMDRPTSSYRNVDEQEESFGQLMEMAAPTGVTAAAAKQRKATGDLKRSGSVDDRTSSMTNVRLFVANPDMDN